MKQKVIALLLAASMLAFNAMPAMAAEVDTTTQEQAEAGAAAEDESILEIENGILKKCKDSSVTEVTIPDYVTKIGSSAFSGCSSLKSVTIPDNVTEIDEYAFRNCSSLTSITFSKNVTLISSYFTFTGCDALEKIEVSSDNVVYTTYDGCLYNKAMTELLYCPGGKKTIKFPESVTTIHWCAFGGFNGGTGSYTGSLENITIPNTVTEIKWYESDVSYYPFPIDGSLVIYVEAGSAAQEYCDSHKVPYQLTDAGTSGGNTTDGTGQGESTTDGTGQGGSTTDGAAAPLVKDLPATGDTSISSSDMQAYFDANKTQAVVFKNENGIRFTFAAGSMKAVDGMTSYDFGAKLVNDYSTITNAPFTKDEFVVRINYNYKGKLPGTASITIPVGTELAGKTLYYYLIKPDGGCTYVTKATVSADGTITVTQDHCSDYVLSTKAPAASPKTGENFPVALYASMGILALLGVLAVMGRKYRVR